MLRKIQMTRKNLCSTVHNYRYVNPSVYYTNLSVIHLLFYYDHYTPVFFKINNITCHVM